MPNAKLYVDHSVWSENQAELHGSLPEFREILCQRLNVAPNACQLALIPVYGLADQPAINIELHIMPHPERTRDLLETLGGDLQAMIGDLADCPCAVRIATLDRQTYVALK